MPSNSAKVGRGLYLLKIDLDSFVPREFLNYHGDEAVPTLEQILGQVKDAQKPFFNMKTQDLLAVMQAAWPEVFRNALAGIEPGLVREVATAHETWASRQSFSDDAAYRTLDAVQQLLYAMASPSVAELERLKLECLESPEDGDSMESLEALLGGGSVKLSNPPPSADSIDSVGSVDSVDSAEAPEPPAAVDPYLAELIGSLQEFDALHEKDRVISETRERIEPVYADSSILQQLTPTLAQALESLGLDRLYEHQAAALDQSRAGANVALAAPPSGGKTLAGAISLAEALLQNPGSHALALYPTPADAAGQAAQLNTILSKVGLSAERYDGDTAPEERERIENNPPSTLITDPETLNSSLLGRSEDWADFLKNLRFVVIGEMQEYSGYFGANMTALLRRLAHRLARLGAAPRYFAATVAGANPAEHAANLTGQPFAPVSATDWPAPKRHYLFVDSAEALTYEQFQAHISAAALACVKLDKSVLILCPTQKFAEQCCDLARQESAGRELNRDCIGLLNDGGEIADGSGKVLFSANPSVSDIDAGRWDGVILAGFPGTFRAARQRIEGAGRDWDQEGFALCYAFNDPMARFYAHNLPAFPNWPGGEPVADSDNAEIIRAHLPALLRESGGRIYSFSAAALGPAIFRELPGYREAAPAPEFPQEELSLRRPAGQTWRLMSENEPTWHWLSENEPIGALSAYQKFRRIYERAIYFRAGVSYRVERIEEESGDNTNSRPQIHLRANAQPPSWRTEPYFDRTLEIREEYRRSQWPAGIATFLGSVTLSEKLTSVQVIDESGHPDTVNAGTPANQDHQDHQSENRVIETYTPAGPNTWEATSRAFWLDAAGILDGEHSAGWAAVEQMLRVGTLLTFPVDSCDTTTHLDGGKVFLVERDAGGIGIAKQVFDRWRDILEVGVAVAQGCPCAQGCANCIVPPQFYGKSLDKVRGIELARRLLEATGGSGAGAVQG